MEAKPILVVRIHHEAVKYGKEGEAIVDRIENKLDKQYFVIILPSNNNDVELEVLNVRDINETTVEDLRIKIKEYINAINRT